jgi:hypothetical protein
MAESISRPRLKRSLVKTTKLLETLNFTSFSNYTTVAHDGASNQAALYSVISNVDDSQQQ